MVSLRLRAAWILLSSVLLWAPGAAAETQALRVLISLDVETSSGCDGTSCRPVSMEDRIYGRRGDAEYGIPLIMDLLEKHGFKGVFFVNSTLDAYYPETEIRRMVQSIVRRGHDVQLHLHPEFRCFKFCREDDLQCRKTCVSGENRLAGNSVAQQRALIQEGLDNLERWAGSRPVSFRAGSLAADEHTLDALREAGVLLDSSLRGPTHPLARYLPLNQASNERGLIELPVFTFVSMNLGGASQYRPLDLESNSFLEVKTILEQVFRHSAGTVMTILHSFSFCRPEGGCPNTRAIDDFDALLGWMASTPWVKVVTVPEWLAEYGKDPMALSGTGYVPQTGHWLTLWRAWQRWDEGPKNKAFVLAHVGMLALVLAVFLIGLRKLRGRKKAPLSERCAALSP